MTPFEKNQIWNELKDLRRNKVGRCAFEDLMKRVNYLETTNNDLINRVRSLEDDIQRIDDAARVDTS